MVTKTDNGNRSLFSGLLGDQRVIVTFDLLVSKYFIA